MNPKIETIHSRLETVLERVFEIKKSSVQITGTSSALAVSFFLAESNSKIINHLPHLVITPDLATAYRLQQGLEFFDPHRQSAVLPAYDVSPYSGLYPGPQTVHERLSFLYKALTAKPGQIFICPCDALIQKTIPEEIFIDKLTELKSGDELPENFPEVLQSLGYSSAPLVEDIGQYAIRGGVIDIYSPAEAAPIRLELFGDQIESLRTFNKDDQRSIVEVKKITIIPAKEILFSDDRIESLIHDFKSSLKGRNTDPAEVDEMVRSMAKQNYLPGMEFLLPLFYKKLSPVLDYFQSALNIYFLDETSILRSSDKKWEEYRNDYQDSSTLLVRPHLEDLFLKFEDLHFPKKSTEIYFSSLESAEIEKKFDEKITYRTMGLADFNQLVTSSTFASEVWLQNVKLKISQWRESNFRIFVSVKNSSMMERLRLAFERMDFLPIKTEAQEFLWDQWISDQDKNHRLIHLIPRSLGETQRLDEEKIIFLREDDFFGRKEKSRTKSTYEDFQDQAKRLSFGDIKPGDYVVHIKHGVGQYEGLKIMNIGGVDNEYIQLGYKEKDKLYLPVYKVSQLQKYSSGSVSVSLDKLGGTSWEKAKIKVKAHLKDIASELLALYAKRSELHRPAFVLNEDEILQFEKGFPFEETNDQMRAINDIHKDLLGTKPMDRLICGDVGFGKTEVAMRAAFFAIQARRQVAVLAPTTVLTFQHVETFRKRFDGWPVNIQVLNRFVSTQEAKKILNDTKEGRVDILIGTHRILSKDIQFKDLGLLIIDEEQKFGVTHKEKIKKLKNSVDTLTLSATPIPRTLNMSLVGIRDLSLINTAPIDRLPTRTFICKFDHDTIRKAIESEIARGGQVYFIHNRIQSIYGVADELRQILPSVKLRVAHGQMDEEELEKAMLAFFHHEIDVLVCTAIVESGMDVTKANTMFIDQAQMFGLSQLYQLRGRVGRSKQRAYCYLILPKNKPLEKIAEERLKVIQENTALGSGLKIAQYDLELRGSGSILGDEQSGHVNTVGYELYMDLLQEALAHAKGEDVDDLELDPEINLRIAALIPDAYISDIRLRLSYYKALADIKSEADLEKIEEELKDQFGEIPEPVVNLMGLMLIRKQCKDLGVRDISAGVKNISLIFTDKTKMKPETVIQLAMRENKKYSLTPDQRLNIRLNTITWAGVHEELNYLLKLI